MNLKESFRYQNFLEKLMFEAGESIQRKEHCLKTSKLHLLSKANPDVEDVSEVVEPEEAFYPNDSVIAFMEWLVREREKLTVAINKAKAGVDFDIDAAIEANKFRQLVNRDIKGMLRFSPSKKTEKECGYKFNNEGNQTSYYYDVEVTTSEMYDRESARKIMRDMIVKADTVSSAIDTAMVTTVVDYTPIFDVNESFDDVMEEFVKQTE